MQISEMTLRNFKSFGDTPQTVSLNGMTALIGSNSTGKTSLITALLRLFGQKNNERNLIKSDFHVSPFKDSAEVDEIELVVEAIVEFPELMEQHVEEVDSLPDFIKHIIIDAPGACPYLRIRLMGKWIQGQNPEGNIEQEINYITVPKGENEEGAIRPVPLHHRNLIQMIYVPAMRDPALQLKNASGTLLWRIFNNVTWPAEFRDNIKEATEPILKLFEEVNDVNSIREVLNLEWKKYHRESRYNNAEIIFNSSDLDSILKKIEIVFSPNEEGATTRISELGDGLKSLFYITLVSSLLEIEQKIESDNKPLLNILAVEEPENHISPHLLGRVVANLNNISLKANSQVILSSHNSAIIKRISPEQIRHLQISEGTTNVNNIQLPNTSSEAYTYIKEAITAYPDLYFSKLVVLGEGDSEEIVLPKILNAFNTYPDETSISIVPLGGRHVNHMWKLLNQLSIPHVTLLDLDRERYGGGWGRIKYVLNQLEQNGRDSKKLRRVILSKTKKVYTYKFKEIEDFHKRKDTAVKSMQVWINKLEKENVYFSYPLDIDFSMLSSFEFKYKGVMPIGPSLPRKPSDEYNEKVINAIKATLKSERAIGETFNESEKELMIWYKSLFLGRGKPSTHLEALKDVTSEDILEKAPAELLRLAEKVEKLIKT